MGTINESYQTLSVRSKEYSQRVGIRSFRFKILKKGGQYAFYFIAGRRRAVIKTNDSEFEEFEEFSSMNQIQSDIITHQNQGYSEMGRPSEITRNMRQILNATGRSRENANNFLAAAYGMITVYDTLRAAGDENTTTQLLRTSGGWWAVETSVQPEKEQQAEPM